MFSVKETIQNFPYFGYWDFIVEFQIDNQRHSFNLHTLDQVFMGENISLKRAIDQKKTLNCFIDVGEGTK
ncbi:MAG: hypothetical protein ACFFDT_24485, partial [Candidatus Hodarchaeota archaeon]